MKLPDVNDEWWKKASSSQNNGGEMECDTDAQIVTNKTSSTSSSSVSSTSSNTMMENGGDNATTEGDNAGTAGGSRTANSSPDNEEDLDEEDLDEAGNKCPPRLFTFQLVNSFGTTEMEKMPDDGKAFKFSSKLKLPFSFSLWNVEILS